MKNYAEQNKEFWFVFRKVSFCLALFCAGVGFLATVGNLLAAWVSVTKLAWQLEALGAAGVDPEFIKEIARSIAESLK